MGGRPRLAKPLDERIIRDIDRPDLLPIVQFVLDRIYQQRMTLGDEVVLTNAAYQALGTLNGAIDTAAEAALVPLGNAPVTALPRLLRSLVVYTAASDGAGRATPALRQVPLDQAAHDAASEQLVRALVDARILVSGRDHSGAAVVGLAHQRVIEAWTRAKDLIAQSAELLRVREDVEEARRRWEAAGKRNDLLIPAGLPLSEAENAAAALRDELPAVTRTFVEKAGRSARMRQRLTAAAALVFLALAVGAGALGLVARTQALRAQQAAAEAEQARGQADRQRQQAEVARAQAVAQRRQAEMRLAAADELLEGDGKAEELRQCLASTERAALRPPPTASREFFVGRWHVDQVDQGAGSTDVDWGDDGTCVFRNMFEAGARSLDLKAEVCTWQFEARSEHEFVIRYQSKKLSGNGSGRLAFKIVNPTRIHNIDQGYDAFRIVCPTQELDAYRKVLADRQRLAAGDPGNLGYQHDLSNILDAIADVRFAQGDYRAALDDYVKALTIRRKLVLSDPGNRGWQRDLSVSYERVGQMHQILDQMAEALSAYKSSLEIRQKLSLADRDAFQAQYDLAAIYERIGNALKMAKSEKVALAAYQQGLLLRQGLADANPGNAQLQGELAVVLYLVSTVSEAADAKAALMRALAILEALEREQKLTAAQATWPNFVRGEIAKLP
jgi:tetratricopeptide (TPR) repeat protein